MIKKYENHFYNKTMEPYANRLLVQEFVGLKGLSYIFEPHRIIGT
ncbi:MAG: hypothetical protein ACXWWA_10670 [Chitinophagaceae bacterium]